MSNKRSAVLHYIDGHIREIKWTLYGIGGIGCLLILRSIYVTRKFINITDIPSRFIEKNITLQGQVKDISCCGNKLPILWTEHTPIVNLPVLSRFLRSTNSEKKCLLPVTVAGINASSTVVQWLEENVKDKHVWFKLLEIQEDQLHAVIKVRKGIRKVNVNKELIVRGIGKLHHYEILPKTRLYLRLIDQLVALEHTADKKGVGMWYTEKRRPLKTIFGTMKNILSLPSSIWKKISRRKES